QRLRVDAEIRAWGAPLVAQARQQRLGHVDRYREADALRGLHRVAGPERRADPDHLTQLIDDRPARVSQVDGGVGLDEERIGVAGGAVRVRRDRRAIDDALLRGHDAGGDAV